MARFLSKGDGEVQPMRWSRRHPALGQRQNVTGSSYAGDASSPTPREEKDKH